MSSHRIAELNHKAGEALDGGSAALGGDNAYSFAHPSLARMGGLVELDGRISWAPEIPGHYQPINSYFIREDDRVYILDTGVAAHRGMVLDQIASLMGDAKEISIFFTRAELDCSGNFSSIYKRFPVTEVISGAVRNPFDSYDELSKLSNTDIKRQNLPLSGTDDMPIGASTRLRLIPSHIRMLTTYWAYDSLSKTLFTSDIFGHTSIPSRSAPTVISDAASDGTTVESVGRHLLEKFGWMAIANTTFMSKWAVDLFKKYDVENIAPTHGCIILGKQNVERHLQYLVEALHSIGLQGSK